MATFSVDFETGNLNAFGEAPLVVASQNLAMRGSWAAEIDYAGDETSGRLFYYGFNGSTSLYMRSYECFLGDPGNTVTTRGFYVPAGLKAGRVVLNAGVGNLQLEWHSTAGASHLQNMQFLNRSANSIFAGGPDFDLPGDGLGSFRWHCLEFQYIFDTNGANGTCRCWLNGTLFKETTTANILTGSFQSLNHFWWGGNFSNGGNAPPYTSYRYIDEVYANNTATRHGPLPYVGAPSATPGVSGITLAWTAPDTSLPAAAGFSDGGVLIRRRTDREPLTTSDGDNPLGGTTRVSAGTTTYLDADVVADTTYYYTLWTYAADGTSQGPAYATATATATGSGSGPTAPNYGRGRRVARAGVRWR